MEPLIKHGTFGTHVIKNPAGTYSFAGQVPLGINKAYETEIAAWAALKGFVRGLPADRQRELAANMRNDFFAFYIET